MNPSESTPADNTRRRAAARSRTGSDSSVESGPLNATIVHRPNPERYLRTGAPDPLTTASSSSVERTIGFKPARSLEDRFVNVGASRSQVASNPDQVLAAILQSVTHLSPQPVPSRTRLRRNRSRSQRNPVSSPIGSKPNQSVLQPSSIG